MIIGLKIFPEVPFTEQSIDNDKRFQHKLQKKWKRKREAKRKEDKTNQV